MHVAATAKPVVCVWSVSAPTKAERCAPGTRTGAPSCLPKTTRFGRPVDHVGSCGFRGSDRTPLFGRASPSTGIIGRGQLGVPAASAPKPTVRLPARAVGLPDFKGLRASVRRRELASLLLWK